MTINKALFSSDKDNWATPEELLIRLYNFKKITLDPCSNHGSLVKSERRYFAPGANNGIDEDGLALPWDRRDESHNYSNPPYGNKIPLWVEKLISEWKQGANSTMLIPSRTGTKVWQKKIFDTASAICFLEGRLQFWDPINQCPAKVWSKKLGKLVESKAPFDSALILWAHTQKDIDKFKDEFDSLGKIK